MAQKRIVVNEHPRRRAEQEYSANGQSIPPCAACGASEFRFLFSSSAFDDARARFEIACCTSCELARTHPFQSDEQLAAYYTAEYYGGGEEKFNPLMERLLLHLTRRRARFLMELIEPRLAAPRVLDVGCGRGVLLRCLNELGCECYGTEIPSYPFPEDQSNINFLHGRLEELRFEPEYFDAVTIWNVLEHLSDPAATLKEIARITRPGGVVAVAVPNFSSLQRRIFKGHWFHLDLPRHTHHFDLDVLLEMLAQNGCKAISVTTSAPEQELYGWVQSWQNATLSRRAPNRLYALLKASNEMNKKSLARKTQLLPLAALAAVSLPIGVLQMGAAALTRAGVIATVYARKS